LFRVKTHKGELVLYQNAILMFYDSFTLLSSEHSVESIESIYVLTFYRMLIANSGVLEILKCSQKEKEEA